MAESSPYAFYAFYQLYNYLISPTSPHLLTANKYGSKSFKEICATLFPDQKVDPNAKTSLFITWKKKSKGHKGENEDGYALRGCIGTFAKLPIATGIEKYSLIAALQDRRFSPINEHELSRLKCSCNILQNFETIYDGKSNKGDIFNWEIGVHGIELIFKHPQSGAVCSATFLPEVIPEQNWDKEETFTNLIEKAGVFAYVADVMDHYEDYFVQVIRYEGNKSAISYKEFKEKLEKLEE